MISVQERKKRYRWKAELKQLEAESKGLYVRIAEINKKALHGDTLTHQQVVDLKNEYEQAELDLRTANRKIEYRETMLNL